MSNAFTMVAMTFLLVLILFLSLVVHFAVVVVVVVLDGVSSVAVMEARENIADKIYRNPKENVGKSYAP